MRVKIEGKHRDFEYVVLSMDMGFRCGYVKVPESHPFYKKDCSEKIIYNLDVHGGITFSSHTIGDECLSDGYWLGFDCIHISTDIPDRDEMSPEVLKSSGRFSESIRELDKILDSILPSYDKPERKIRNDRFVESHCRNLCDQLASVQNLPKSCP